MLSEHRALRVFLCHAHSDKNVVWDLYLRLIGDGVDAWLDKEKLLPGQDWEQEIRKAVRESDVVVVCLSKQFNEAGFRQKEVRLALETAMEKPEGEIFIIPARLEECDTLESLRKWHRVDLFEDNAYDRLLAALRARANKIGAPLQGSQPEKKQRKRLEILNKEAVRYEVQGDLWRALQTYYSVRRIDPAFQRVDMKIEQLERELREAKAQPYVTPKPASSMSWGLSLSLGIAILLAVIGIYIYLMGVMTRVSFAAEPTPTPTSTSASIQPAGTATPCPVETTEEINLDFGRVIIDSFCPRGDTNTFRFSGTSGDRIRIQVTYDGGNLRPCVQLIAPDSTRTGSCENVSNNVIDMTLNQTGTYKIVVDVWFLGSGEFTLVVERL